MPLNNFCFLALFVAFAHFMSHIIRVCGASAFHGNFYLIKVILNKTYYEGVEERGNIANVVTSVLFPLS
ncbi:unnamed protein product [Camellia sinensis]